MKTTKRILATLLAALMTLGAFTLAGSAAPDESTWYTAIYGEFKISSPDQDVNLVGTQAPIFLDSSGNGTVQIWIRRRGTYVVELAPGVTEATKTSLVVAAGSFIDDHDPSKTVDLTLRDVRMNAWPNYLFASSPQPLLPAIDLIGTGGGDTNIILRLEGENFVGGDSNGAMGPGYLIGTGSELGVDLTIEGPGSLTVDARQTSFGGIGGNTNYKGSLTINSGTVTAYGGEGQPGIGGAMGIVSYRNNGTVNFNGGTVTAVGGAGAPGIGDITSKGTPTFGTYNINGGTVTATGGAGAPGIGGVWKTSEGDKPGGTVNLNGGTLIGTVYSANQMYTAIYGEFKISSPDQDVTNEGLNDGVVWFENDGSTDMLMIMEPGHYTVELKPGVTTAVRTRLWVAPQLAADPHKRVDLTLRNVRAECAMENTVTDNQILSFGQYSLTTLRLEGENSFASNANSYHSYNAVMGFGKGTEVTIEGPGSLSVDATASEQRHGIGQAGYPDGTGTLIINSGTVTAQGGKYANGIGRINVVINGGSVTAFGGDEYAGIGGSFQPISVSINGGVVNAVGGTVAPGIGATTEDPYVTVIITEGIVFSNRNGAFYGNEVTVTENAEFPAGSALTIPAGKTLAVLEGKTVQNNGTITNNGTILANMAGYGNLIPAPVQPHTHSYAATVTAPACAAQGFTTYTCVCGDSYVGNYVAALGHDWGDWKITASATKDTEGVETRVCKRVNSHTETRPVYYNHTHNYASTVTAPACAAQGFTTYTCVCGDSYVGNYVAALGHDWGDWKITVSATKDTEGVETRVCKRDNSHTETRPAYYNHTHNYAGAITAPACAAQGFTTYTCGCGDSYVGNYVAALGHDWGVWTITRPAAKTQAGEEIRVCKNDASHTETRVIPIPPIKVIPGTTVEATVWNWILYILFFGWKWMK